MFEDDNDGGDMGVFYADMGVSNRFDIDMGVPSRFNQSRRGPLLSCRLHGSGTKDHSCKFHSRGLEIESCTFNNPKIPC